MFGLHKELARNVCLYPRGKQVTMNGKEMIIRDVDVMVRQNHCRASKLPAEHGGADRCRLFKDFQKERMQLVVIIIKTPLYTRKKSLRPLSMTSHNVVVETWKVSVLRLFLGVRSIRISNYIINISKLLAQNTE